MEQEVTFSFGANWKRYVNDLSEQRINAAHEDVERWLGKAAVADRRVVDIGCGSGVHSLAFFNLGARELVSFDVDPASVEATRSLWQRAGSPAHWRIFEGSILDRELVSELARPGFDVVYSWGVLHHTGAMWQAIDHAIELIADAGLLWIALYAKGPRYQRDLALKQSFNRASPLRQRWIYYRYLVGLACKWLLFRRFGDLRKLLRPRHSDRERGMSIHWDIIDWLGGLPYEVASVGEVVELTRRRGLILEKIDVSPEGGNHVFLLSR
jgi:SAM-dependent methyltransferase